MILELASTTVLWTGLSPQLALSPLGTLLANELNATSNADEIAEDLEFVGCGTTSANLELLAAFRELLAEAGAPLSVELAPDISPDFDRAAELLLASAPHESPRLSTLAMEPPPSMGRAFSLRHRPTGHRVGFLAVPSQVADQFENNPLFEVSPSVDLPPAVVLTGGPGPDSTLLVSSFDLDICVDRSRRIGLTEVVDRALHNASAWRSADESSAYASHSPALGSVIDRDGDPIVVASIAAFGAIGSRVRELETRLGHRWCTLSVSDDTVMCTVREREISGPTVEWDTNSTTFADMLRDLADPLPIPQRSHDFQRICGAMLSGTTVSRSLKITPGRILDDRLLWELEPSQLTGEHHAEFDTLLARLSAPNALLNSSFDLSESEQILIGYEADGEDVSHKIYIAGPTAALYARLVDDVGTCSTQQAPPSHYSIKWSPNDPERFRIAEYRGGDLDQTAALRAISRSFDDHDWRWAHVVLRLAANQTAKAHHLAVRGTSEPEWRLSHGDLLDVVDSHGRRSVDLQARRSATSLGILPQLSWLSEVAELDEHQRDAMVSFATHLNITRVIGGTAGDRTPFITLYGVDEPGALT
jgi:hypothetical protein